MKKIIFNEVNLVNGGAHYLCRCNSPKSAPIKNMMYTSIHHDDNNDLIVAALSPEEGLKKCVSACTFRGGIHSFSLFRQ